MTDCTFSKIEFPRVCGRVVAADFGGGDISSNGGAPLLAAADRRLGLLPSLARHLDDRRQAGKVDHQLLPLLRQRVFALELRGKGPELSILSRISLRAISVPVVTRSE